MESPSPGRSRRRKAHPAARSRRVVAVGSAAACVALTGAFAYQNLGASNPSSAPSSPSSSAPVRSYDRSGWRGDDGFSTAPFTAPDQQVPNAQVPSAPDSGFGSGSAAVPGQPDGNGANTTSGGS